VAVDQDWAVTRISALEDWGEMQAKRSVSAGRMRAAMPVPSPKMGNRADIELDVASMRDAFMMTATKFATTGGSTVHVSFNYSSTCPDGSADGCQDVEKCFIIFKKDGGGIKGVSAYAVANFGFMHGSRDVVFDGSGPYTVRVMVKSLNDPMTSSLQISKGSSKFYTANTGDVLNAMKANGKAVVLGQTQYQAFIATNISQDANRNLIIDANNRTSLVLLRSEDNSLAANIKLDDISPKGSRFPEFAGYVFYNNGNKTIVISRQQKRRR